MMATRQTDRLKALQVKNLKAPGMYADGGGLYLQVSPALTKSWSFRYTLDGKSREMGLGSANTLDLIEAREAARKQRQILLDKLDPIEVRDAARQRARLERESAITFKDCAERYIKAHRAGWKNAKHAEQWTSTLATHVYPVFGDTIVAKVDRAAVLRALDPIWRKLPETASRVRGRVERILDWAKANGYRTGDNPAEWSGNLEANLPARAKVRTVTNHPALPYQQLGAFLTKLQAVDGIAAKALHFAILTAARTREVVEARWEEIDIDGALWVIPAARMKAGKEHRIPLSADAVAVLKALPKINDYVFPSTLPKKPLSNMAMLQVLKRMGRTDITVHGFRSTFRDWAGETTAYPREVCEHALAHQLKDKAEAAYQRGDLLRKRRALMDDWAKFCSMESPAAAKVIGIRA